MSEAPVTGQGGSARRVALRGNDWSVLDDVWPDEPPRVSVVVVHYEQQRELDRTLLALGRQDHPRDRLEIVVVDDGSASPPRVPDGVTLVVQPDRGFRLSAARNAGAAVATGEVLCFVDADTAPEPSYVRMLTRLPALAPDVVTVGRRRHADLSGVAEDAPIAEAAPGVELPSPTWLDDAYRASRDLLDADDLSYRFVIGAVIACSASLFASAGGFDESFTSYGGEDWEWAYRAWLHGAAFAHVADAVAWHDGPSWEGRPEALLAQKNAEALRLASVVTLPGSGPRGLRGGRYADVAVTVPPAVAPASLPSDAAWFVCLDSLAADLPLAALPDDPRALDRVRLTIDLKHPVRIHEGVLRALVDRVGAERLGSLSVLDDSGEELLVVRSRRADERHARWGRSDLFETVSVGSSGILRLSSPPDVAAYLGGWA